DRNTLHIPDVLADPQWEGSELARLGDFRSAIGVPLLRDGDILGVLVLYRREVLPFTEKQIELVETFADQAVIAIENTRLFEAEQASKRELQKTLEYQTAISGVLSAISRSPNHLQSVFDAIVTSSKRLLRAYSAIVSLVIGDQLTLGAFTSVGPESDKWLK